MSMPKTSGISSDPQPAPIISGESQGADTPKVMDEAITGAEAYRSEKQIGTPSYADRTASILQNTYFFTPEEARQISAFATAVQNAEPKLKVEVEPNLWERIKMLCYKLLEFLGNGKTQVYLHKDGMATFNELKNTFLSPKNRGFVLNFLEENKENPDVLKGFARLLGVNISGNINSIEDFYKFFINPQLLKKCPDVKSFLEQEVLPMTKEEVLAGLRANLESPSIGGKDWTDVFSSDNQIFRDLGRTYVGIFHIGNKTIEIGPFNSSSGRQLAYQKLTEEIGDLPPELQEKVHEFCKNFPAQGVFSIFNPRLSGQYGRIDCHSPRFEVSFQDNGSAHVKVYSENGKGNQLYWDDTGRNTIYPEITTPICKFEFDYHPEDGHSSNIQLTEYSGQTVSIDLKATRSM